MADELAGDDVAISWEDARDANLANWNERVPIHLNALRARSIPRRPRVHLPGGPPPTSPSSNALPAPRGGWLGCVSSAVPYRHRHAVAWPEGARGLLGSISRSRRCEAAADFATSELGVWMPSGSTPTCSTHERPSARSLGADRAFDVVYTSIGTDGVARRPRQVWARADRGAAASGWHLLHSRRTPCHPCSRRAARGDSSPGTATSPMAPRAGWDRTSLRDGDGTIAHTRTYGFPHPLTQILQALIGAGLRADLARRGPDACHGRFVALYGGARGRRLRVARRAARTGAADVHGRGAQTRLT